MNNWVLTLVQRFCVNIICAYICCRCILKMCILLSFDYFIALIIIHIWSRFMFTLFVCKCRCALKHEDCCCIVLLTTLSPLDTPRLSTQWLPVPLMAVGLSQPFRSSAQMYDYHFTCIYPWLFHMSFHTVFTNACTCQKWQIKLFIQLTIVMKPIEQRPVVQPSVAQRHM